MIIIRYRKGNARYRESRYNKSMEKKEILEKIKKTASSYKLSGYHCSESVIRTLNDVFELGLSGETLRTACGFRGGGGGMRDRCGILEAGIMVISYLYGRYDLEGETWTYSYLIRELHRRFKDHFQTIYCRDIYFKQKEMQVPNTCHDPVVEGSVLIGELLFDAEELLKNAPEEEKNR